MFQWRRPLASTALMVVTLSVMLAVAGQSLASPIRVSFTVLGDPADPVNAGITTTGNFTFDSSFIPIGGGTVSNTLGLGVGSVSMSWDGQTWTTANADAYLLTFTPDGVLTAWALCGDINGSNCGPGPDFFVEAGSGNYFVYSTTATSSNYEGTLTTWDAAALPIIAAFTESTLGNLFALSSTGDLYRVPTSGLGCELLGGGQLVGNMFYGPPPSPIVSAGTYQDGFWVCLQSGDVYSWCSASTTSILAGNIFSAAGVTAVGLSVPRLQNHVALARPNPFNPSVQVPYTVTTPGRVSLRVFDVSGRSVRALEDVIRVPGQYTAHWDGTSDAGALSASGTYLLRVLFGDGSKSEQKVTLVR